MLRIVRISLTPVSHAQTGPVVEVNRPSKYRKGCIQRHSFLRAKNNADKDQVANCKQQPPNCLRMNKSQWVIQAYFHMDTVSFTEAGSWKTSGVCSNWLEGNEKIRISVRITS